MKRVRIGLWLDAHFISMLNANVGLSELRKKDQLDPLQVLGLVTLLEARGATSEQIHAETPITWRGSIQPDEEHRKVVEP